ncbi:Uncharacterised protein [Vibrio cholerae]|nr:Uncharacterised protein [Vibrio cholerae]
MRESACASFLAKATRIEIYPAKDNQKALLFIALLWAFCVQIRQIR